LTLGKTLLSSAPTALALGLALPIAAGLLGTLAPALRGDGFTTLAAWDGLWCAVKLSIGTGLISTLAALIITLLIVAALANTRSFALIRRTLSPLLALPHAAAALGLAFLISPSGWMSRALSPWATGWENPPDLLILNDPMGLSLTLGLIAKELPFLLLMALAALPQIDAERRAQVAASLGHGRIMGFTITTLPALYQRRYGDDLGAEPAAPFGRADHQMDGRPVLNPYPNCRRRSPLAAGNSRNNPSPLADNRAHPLPPDPRPSPTRATRHNP
jgi:putative thiamine transport system permease protein